MTKEEFIEYVNCGREIEFTYKGKRYSVTYYNDHREKYISLCEFYKEPIDVSTADEVLKLTINGVSLEKIFLCMPDSDIDIF